MNKDTSVKTGKALPLFFYTATFTAIGMFFQAMAVVFGYDPVMQVFKSESTIGTISCAILFAECIIYAILSIFLLKGNKQLPQNPLVSDASAFFSTVAGCVMIVSSVMLFIETGAVSENVRTITTTMTVLSIPAGISFILSSLNQSLNKILSYLGFFPVLWAATCLLRIYFDTGAAINDPIRILFQISFVVVMLALLFEQKVRVGKKGTLPLIIFSGIAVILGCAAVLSMTVLFFIPRTVTIGEVLLAASELLICLNFFVNMFSELKQI